MIRLAAIFCAIIFLATHCTAQVQQTGQWQGKKCAVALTYDDAIDADLDNALPALDSLQLKATFYLSGISGVLNRRMEEWRTAVRNGHELGNHTYFHPCIGQRPGREFVRPDYDLGNYTIRRITDEIRMTNTVLHAIDGKSERSFAYPCGDTRIGDSSYIDPVKKDFVAARGVKGESLKLQQVDLYNIGCYSINGQTGEQLIVLVKKAMTNGTLLVFLFHGVGGGHAINVSLAAHRQLLLFLKQHEPELWIAPLIDIARYIKANKADQHQ